MTDKQETQEKSGDQTQVMQQVETPDEPEAELTVAAPQPGKPEELKVAEADVAPEWNVDDVILNLYEVKQIHTGGGHGLGVPGTSQQLEYRPGR